MLIYFIFVAFGMGFIILILLLLIINAIEFFFYIRSFYRLMKRIDQDPWNILDVALALNMTPTQVKILYTKFCEVRSSCRSLFRSTK